MNGVTQSVAPKNKMMRVMSPLYRGGGGGGGREKVQLCTSRRRRARRCALRSEGTCQIIMVLILAQEGSTEPHASMHYEVKLPCQTVTTRDATRHQEQNGFE